MNSVENMCFTDIQKNLDWVYFALLTLLTNHAHTLRVIDRLDQESCSPGCTNMQSPTTRLFATVVEQAICSALDAGQCFDSGH